MIACEAGYIPVLAGGGDEALSVLAGDREFAAVLLDLVMPDRDGFAVMEAMRQRRIAIPVVATSPTASVEQVRSAFHHGAVDVMVGTVTPQALEAGLQVARRTTQLRNDVAAELRAAEQQPAISDFLVRSQTMHRVPALIMRAARNTLPVLVEGEAGTGKQLAARIIHATSDRRTKPFVVFDGSMVDPRESERLLFGSRGGQSAVGAFEAAKGGTLFLSGAGMLSADLQSRLVDFLEHGTIAPVGSKRPERADVRLVVSSRTRLLRLTEAGHFRDDLFYRLNVLPITFLPLRDRREDIGALADLFVLRFSRELARPVREISTEASDLLRTYDWPGNVSELQRTIYRAVALASGDRIEAGDLPHLAVDRLGRMAASSIIVSGPSRPVHVDDLSVFHQHQSRFGEARDRFVGPGGEVMTLETLERDLIAFALEQHGGRMSRVARALGIGRSTLYRKIREFGFEDEVDPHAA